MCLDCAYHQRQRAAGNRDGSDGIGNKLTKKLKDRGNADGDGQISKLQVEMARGAENVGRIRV